MITGLWRGPQYFGNRRRWRDDNQFGELRPRPASPRVRRSACALIEQDGAHLRVADVDLARLLDPDVHAAVHRGPRQHGVEPALHVRKVVRILALALPARRPADA